mmetsp:Transcript_59752/g.109825  ORF Transcript_59752/g.109825 Transcript_59752/m.109825 type:complete len:606 (-) Transcript_59752:131-1948(-)
MACNSFDGIWWDDCPYLDSDEGFIEMPWASGTIMGEVFTPALPCGYFKLRIDHRKIVFHMDDEVNSGELTVDGKRIEWDNGEVWKKLEDRSMGTHVCLIAGLRSEPGKQLNGQLAQIMSVDKSTQRLCVRIHPQDLKQSWKKIKLQNLKPCNWVVDKGNWMATINSDNYCLASERESSWEFFDKLKGWIPSRSSIFASLLDVMQELKAMITLERPHPIPMTPVIQNMVVLLLHFNAAKLESFAIKLDAMIDFMESKKAPFYSFIHDRTGRPYVSFNFHQSKLLRVCLTLSEVRVAVLTAFVFGKRIPTFAPGTAVALEGPEDVLSVSDMAHSEIDLSAEEIDVTEAALTEEDAEEMLDPIDARRIEEVDLSADVIDVIEAASMEEDAETVDPIEASRIEEERWATGVEALIRRDRESGAGGDLHVFADYDLDMHIAKETRFVVLTFNKIPKAFDGILRATSLAISLAKRGVDVQPSWANGAKILADIDHGIAAEARVDFAPWHVLVEEKYEAGIYHALRQALKWQDRPTVKPKGGRLSVPSPNDSSLFIVSSPSSSGSERLEFDVESSPDSHENVALAWPQYIVRNTFVHIPGSSHHSPRSAQTI